MSAAKKTNKKVSKKKTATKAVQKAAGKSVSKNKKKATQKVSGKSVARVSKAKITEQKKALYGVKPASTPPMLVPFPEVHNFVIENIRPSVDDGQFSLRREPMDMVEVTADIFRHGHEKMVAHVLYRKKGDAVWQQESMKDVGNDEWTGSFQVRSTGFYEYFVEARTVKPEDEGTRSALYEVRVDPGYARFSAWYEMFPRSQGTDPNGPASWDDCIARLDDIRGMGFDTLYLVPIHPIGVTNRKGANNALKTKPGEPGCPYAVGNEYGGHYAVDPDMGTMEDFERFMDAARGNGFHMALDIALNCSPDHPHVEEHPEWYFHEEDGSIKFAENPPKKYEDIYPYDFWNENWKALWTEIRDMLLYWVDKGFSIFRIDNPHTKPFALWEWIIREIKLHHPQVIFLAEAFTRPKLMYRLAKIGFDLSYTYFTWRNEKWEIEEYLKELTNPPASEFMRGIFFPSTPDIFPEPLWEAPPAAFAVRFFLASTASSVYGMYNGYELCENTKNPSKEELWYSEKYQYKTHDWNSPTNIKGLITRINQIRNTCPAMAEYDNLTIHHCDNDQIMVYSRRLEDRRSVVLCILNLDPYNVQSGMVYLNGEALSLGDDELFVARDLLDDQSYQWKGLHNYVELDPARVPGHIFALLRY